MSKKNDDRPDKPDFIFLIGAGASSDIGYPSLDDLMSQAIIGNDEIADLIRRVRDSVNAQILGRAAFEEVIAKIKDYIRITSMLKDDYVLRSEMVQIPHNLLDGSITLKFQKALARSYQILVDYYGPQVIRRESREIKSLIDLMLAVAKICPSYDFYTTNYDCTYQVLASDCDELSFMSHIDNNDGIFRDRAWYNIRQDLVDKGLPEIYIHRLHGCVAWFNMTNPEAGTGYTREQHGAGGKESLRIPDYELSRMSIKLVGNQILGTIPTFASAFDELNRHLKSIHTLIVWGYSFRDLEVTRQINQALLAAQQPFKIYYIDPFLTEYAARNNILNTLRNAPVPVSENFMPQQIKWTPTDGKEMLIRKLTAIIKESVL